jgi:hypothetical protein
MLQTHLTHSEHMDKSMVNGELVNGQQDLTQ